MKRVSRLTERFALRRSRAMRWTVSIGLAGMVMVGLVLLFLLTQATTNRAMYEENYTRLFSLNVVVASLLLIINADSRFFTREKIFLKIKIN